MHSDMLKGVGMRRIGAFLSAVVTSNLIVLSLVCVSSASFYAATAHAEPDVVEILRTADHARGNTEGLTWTLDITSHEGDKTRDMTVEVKTRGYDFLSETRNPAKYKGQKLLMVSGNMWFHKPGLSKPVPIAPRQRLMGQAAYGDIAATNYAEDYEGELVGEELIDDEPCLVFALKARERNATYDSVRYWVSVERGVGVRGEYFTVSGKLIKTARMTYGDVTKSDGSVKPFVSTIVITDAILQDNVTTLEFRDPKFEKLPDRLFNVNLLRR
ncbi:MAG: outer membrane lipoprotein-sorting protein [Candidatus Eisenbacteria bacterium]|uniref:Outer membrane lipoprotein-sorting protein n=1 Tax=Eiseniibacteriota bacterium TaxID=2212470 RepID=A0A7Y2EBY7_UNCEI|nr:outer membrane lipoprotein-sorting protein [Candidatus Eisenbacteria bacterium]